MQEARGAPRVLPGGSAVHWQLGHPRNLCHRGPNPYPSINGAVAVTIRQPAAELLRSCTGSEPHTLPHFGGVQPVPGTAVSWVPIPVPVPRQGQPGRERQPFSPGFCRAAHGDAACGSLTLRPLPKSLGLSLGQPSPTRFTAGYTGGIGRSQNPLLQDKPKERMDVCPALYVGVCGGVGKKMLGGESSWEQRLYSGRVMKKKPLPAAP